MKKLTVIYVAIYILAIIGEVRCVVKAIRCNWNPIGKSEVIYTAAACTGLGSVVGWINIEDN